MKTIEKSIDELVIIIKDSIENICVFDNEEEKTDFLLDIVKQIQDRLSEKGHKIKLQCTENIKYIPDEDGAM